ncbi:MAG: LysR family transcriptional regulator ArgP [Alphaproteobacteria bacterium]|nr:LysR family transcriptional regulator ArgP [Alphaproteobacteria bacterium]
MFDYKRLEALSAVIREGSFERASQVLNITQSAVSQRIQALEVQTGSILVVREKPVRPTEAGARLFQHTETVRLLEFEYAKAGAAVPAEAPEAWPTLRIGVNSDSLGVWFEKAMAQIAQRHAVLFDIVAADQEDTLELLKTGGVIAAVTSDGPVLSGFRKMQLGSLEYAAAASPDYVSRFLQAGVSPETLSHSPAVTFDRSDTLPDQWAQTALGQAVRFPTHWIPSVAGHLKACLEGACWGMHLTVMAEEHLNDGTLVELAPGVRVRTPLIWRYSSRSSALMRELSDSIRAAAQSELIQVGA